ncbi:MAG: acyl-CoA/acyl-ACP dehydrogenase [Magnetovibrio sp.]|nr:acyl-CoA/acyl-ACP dehydrogenase [Magnetovibrio sp.]
MSNYQLDGVLALCQQAAKDCNILIEAARSGVQAKVVKDGRINSALLDQEQFAAHGFSWLQTYVRAVEQLVHWAERLDADGELGELESLILQVGVSEYLSQMAGGIPMSQVEMVRPRDMGVSPEQTRGFYTDAVTKLVREGNDTAARVRIAELLDVHTGMFGKDALGDEMLDMIQEQFRRFASEEVAPNAPTWHDTDILIPDEIINQMGELGVFGLTIEEEFGGLGMSKTSMCVVTEELSRGYIGVGSLGTRSEIAGELITIGGTPEQKEKYLPKIAAGELLPTAVFTEPNTGSDLASLKTRAVKDGDVYRITGNKTWITHAARSDMMTLLARTNPDEPGYKGLSMFLIEKPRGTEDNPFPLEGMTGTEIEVLGYRGMKEYELAFDNLEVPASALLGGEEGQGFKQLMSTFEAARIQTAARAVGVAANALELGLRYAHDRIQFGKPIVEFPRVAAKLGWMAVETQIARQISFFAAREKDVGHRTDIEAGMAKLLAARVAWSNADNALQVHGGNGYALEYPISRVLVDSRILNIFEGAAEIQAHVIARGLLKP